MKPTNPPLAPALPNSTCSRCGAPLFCGATAGAAHCWCAEMPTLPQPDLRAGCLCRACLRAALAETQSPRDGD